MKDKKIDLFSHILKRIHEMDSERQSGIIDWITEWKVCEEQYIAPTAEDNEGNFVPNSLMEQNTIEMELWRRAGMPKFDVKPDPFTANIAEAEAAKYVLDNFLDRENFYKQQMEADQRGEIYGTRVFYTWLRMEREIVKELNAEKTVGSSPWAEFYDTNNYKENERITYFMTPMALKIQDLLIDDRNFRQPDFDLAEDCVMIERLAPETFRQRYEDNKLFNQDVVKSSFPINDEQTSLQTIPSRGQIVLYHYFNKITKTYGIVVNKNWLLYEGALTYVHGKLPFSVGQCYPNAMCICWRSTPRKLRSEKAFENDLYESTMKAARLTASKILITSWEPTEDIITVPWTISLAKFNGGIEGTKDIDTRVDILPMLKATEIVESKKRQNTWVDINAPFQEQAPTLWQTEIIEENKAMRQRAKDTLRDMRLDDALTKTLCNIKQFAPILLATRKEIVLDDNVIKKTYEFPKLTLKNVSVKKTKDWPVFTEDLWNIWYLELKPDTIQWNLTVRVVTPNTINKTLVALEKERVKEMIDNFILLAKIVWLERVEEYVPLKDIMDKMTQVYGYSRDMTPSTKLAEKKKALYDQIKSIRDMIKAAQEWIPWMEWMWWGQPWMEAMWWMWWMWWGQPNLAISTPNVQTNQWTQAEQAFAGSSPAELIGLSRDMSSMARTGRRGG